MLFRPDVAKLMWSEDLMTAQYTSPLGDDNCSLLHVLNILKQYSAGPSFIKPCNFSRNYAVYWSQLTANRIVNSACGRVHETNLVFAQLKRIRIDLDLVRLRWGIPIFVLCLNNLFRSSCGLCRSYRTWDAMMNVKDIQCIH